MQGQEAGRLAGSRENKWGSIFQEVERLPCSSRQAASALSAEGAPGEAAARRIPSRSGSAAAATVTAANCLSGLSTETLTAWLPATGCALPAEASLGVLAVVQGILSRRC